MRRLDDRLGRWLGTHDRGRAYGHGGTCLQQRLGNGNPGFGPNEIKARDRNDINATYPMADAMFSACFLNACLRHADTVQMANIAPLVNTRGPLFVHPKGIVKRTTFHVMSMYANLLGSRAAKAAVTSDPFRHGGAAVPAVDAVATCDAGRKEWRIALVNRHPTATARCAVQFDKAAASGTCWATVLSGDAPEAFNDVDRPDRVVPRRVELEFRNGAVALPPHSLTILEMTRNSAPELLVANGGFESAAGQDRPDGWAATQWGDGAYRAAWSEDRPHSGRRCVLLESEAGADCAWVQRVDVEPHTKYRLSGWIRTQDVAPGTGCGAFLNVQEIQGVKTKVTTGTSDWVRVEMTFDTDPHDTIQVNCLLGGWGRSSGRIWYDEITLDPVKPRQFHHHITTAPIMKDHTILRFAVSLIAALVAGSFCALLPEHSSFAAEAPKPPLDETSKASVASATATDSDQEPFIGLQPGLGSLPLLGRGRTRSLSAENPTGRKGRAAWQSPIRPSPSRRRAPVPPTPLARGEKSGPSSGSTPVRRRFSWTWPARGSSSTSGWSRD